MATEYRVVPGHERYRVSTSGTVQSFAKGEWRDLKLSPNRAGYPCVSLSTPDGPKAIRVHTLVLIAFVGPRPEGMVCRHLNDNPADNRLENLAWGTYSENSRDSVRNFKEGKVKRRGQPKMPRPFFREQRGTWCVQIGKKQHNLGADKAQAFAEYHRLMNSAGHAVAASTLTAHELCELFLDHVQRHRKPSTYGWYANHLQGFTDRCGNLKARDVKPLHVSGWLDSHPTWGPSSRRGAITAVKRCWAWAVEEGRLDANPLGAIKRPPMGRRAGIQDDEAEKVVAAIQSPALRDFVEGMMATGCRPGELSDMKAADVAADGRSIVVRNKLGTRVVTLTGKAAALVARLASARPEGPIFLNTRGKPWNRNSLRCAFRQIRKRTGIAGAVPYAMRHLFGTMAIERGVDSLLVAELMGHKDVSMLQQHYAHHKAETLRKAAEKATGAGDGGTPT